MLPGFPIYRCSTFPRCAAAGCVAGVEKAIQALDASAQITADIEARRVEVTTSADRKALITALDAAGYPAEAA